MGFWKSDDNYIHLKDLETVAAPLSERAKLLEAIFEIGRDSVREWPGLIIYLEYLESRLTVCDLSCFTPIWKLLHNGKEVKPDDLLNFLYKLVQLFKDKKGILDSDHVVKDILQSCGKSDQELDNEELSSSNEAIFHAVSWLSMLYPLGDSQVDILSGPCGPKKAVKSALDNSSCTTNYTEVRYLIPQEKAVVNFIKDRQSGLIHTSTLNAASLSLIDKIRIEWTDNLASHLLFDPAKRIISLYRLPTFCAMNASEDTVLPVMRQ